MWCAAAALIAAKAFGDWAVTAAPPLTAPKKIRASAIARILVPPNCAVHDLRHFIGIEN
jgi:hypothetical protein